MSLMYSYIGFGANLGEPRETLARVVQEMDGGMSKVRRISRLFRTTLWGGAEGPDFFNAVIELETTLSALELLQLLQSIERICGRERSYSNAPRTCDLDLLLQGDESISSEKLVVPHPRVHLRRFVLAPLCDLIPEEKHPILQITFRKLLDNLQDKETAFPIASVKIFCPESSYE